MGGEEKIIKVSKLQLREDEFVEVQSFHKSVMADMKVRNVATEVSISGTTVRQGAVLGPECR